MKSLEAIHATLKKQFEEFQETEDQYSNQIIPQIEKVIWATESQYYLELLRVERARLPKGRILKSEPTVKENCVKLGFNKMDELIYEEQWGSHPLHGYKKYFIQKQDTIYSYRFNRNDGALDEIEYQKTENGLPLTYGDYSFGKATTADEYEYQNGKLVKIKSMWRSEPYIQYPTYLIDYDLLDNIKTINRVDEPSDFFPDGQDMIIYKKHSYSIRELTEILIQEFVDCVCQQLKEKRSEKFLLITLENPFNSDEWLPFKFYFANSIEKLSTDIELIEFIDTDELSFQYYDDFNEKLQETANLLMQETELNEKYDVPLKILQKTVKILKRKLESLENQELIILPLDLPDDYYEPVYLTLQGLYSKREVSKMLD